MNNVSEIPFGINYEFQVQFLEKVFFSRDSQGTKALKMDDEKWIFVIVSCQEGTNRCVPPSSRLCTGGRGARGSRSKNLLKGAMKQMLVQGRNLLLPDEARELGENSTPKPENQDSQHKPTQPRGSFPEQRAQIGPTEKEMEW